MGQLILYNKKVEEPRNYNWSQNGGGFAIKSFGWGTSKSGVHVGDKVLVIKEPPPDSHDFEFKFKGMLGIVQEIKFDLLEDYPGDPVIRVCFDNIPENILLDEDGDYRKFEFYKAELLVVR